jgi:hypothetical protein
MDINEATQRFETWLRRRIPVVEADLVYKHEQMRADPFLFFRATYYRWVQVWPKLCPELARGPVVMAVGDLHLENFGTWRDSEGRLVWGVNDFDEAHPMSFANDLVRLAVSALLSLHVEPDIPLTPSNIFAELVEGYQASVANGGEPLILMEKHLKLRRMATLRQPAEFWSRFDAKTTVLTHDLPDGLRRSFRKLLPEAAKPSYRVVHVPKGLGSLGRRRYLAVADWQGGMIAREAKDVVPSAYLWAAREKAGKGNPWLERTVEAAVRCADPLYQVKGGWLLRRLGPDCCRIDLEQLRHHEDLASLVYSMGWETANVHLGLRGARKKISQALGGLRKSWLKDAAQAMFDRTLKDWHKFRKTKERAAPESV